MVDVAAPATLPAGYTFDAVYDGVTFPVKVVSWNNLSRKLHLQSIHGHVCNYKAFQELSMS